MRMKQKTWIALILLGTVAANGVAYVVLRGRRSAEPVVQPAPAPSVAPAPAAAQPPAEHANEGLARARRAAGLAALEDRDYDKAVSEFTEALSLRKDKGDLVELLRIAQDLRTREQARPRPEPERPAPEKPAPEPEPVAKATSRPRPTRVASRAQPAEEPGAAEAARSGLLLITSTPPGLVVLLDGKPVDLTPARVSVRAGSHRVALAQGEHRLFEDTVEVAEDTVRSINRDLTAELVAHSPPPSSARPALPPTLAPASAPTPAAPSPAVAAPAPAPAPSPEPPAPAVAAPSGKGDLEVASPSLYGEIWINGRPYGFPPVAARGLAAGQAKVEVRVNGVVKRRMTVEVVPGRSTAVRVR